MGGWAAAFVANIGCGLSTWTTRTQGAQPPDSCFSVRDSTEPSDSRRTVERNLPDDESEDTDEITALRERGVL